MKYRSVVPVAAAAIAIGAGLLAQGRGSSLFGKDSYQPDEYQYYCRVFQTTDEYLDYYRDYKRLYYKNAVKLVPGLPAERFPS
jgi:hypothetical protein